MSRLSSAFSKPQPSLTANSQNEAGYAAWSGSLKGQYVQMLVTNVLGRTYYASERNQKEDAVKLHFAMRDADPVFMGKALVYAREQGYMRSQPVLGLAVLISDGDALDKRRGVFSQVFDRVVKTPADLFDWMAVCDSLGVRTVGRRIQRVVGGWLTARVSEYWAIKYGRRDDKALAKALRRFHPQHSELFRWIRGHEADLSGLPKIQAYEDLKAATTDEERVAAIKAGRLPHEVVTTYAGKSKAVWSALVDQMPVFALTHNLATLARHGVLNQNKAKIRAKLSDEKTILNSKMFPFRFLSAADKVESGWAKDAVRTALEIACKNLPDIKGRTAIALDISGSMGWASSGNSDGVPMVKHGAIAAIAMARKTVDVNPVMLFDDRLQLLHVSTIDSILTQANRVAARGGTNLSLPITRLIEQKQVVDNIIVITDHEQNHGEHFYDALALYRRRFNPKAKLFMLDLSSQKSRIAPATDPNNWMIYGWSDQVFRIIGAVTNGMDGQVELVEKIEL